MALARNATHLTETSAFPSAKTAVLCDVCRKHVDMPTQCGGSCADACDESPHESTEKNTSTIQLVQKDAGHFDCNICLDGCHDPVVTFCGHLFCWPCLYYWLSLHSVSQECPICKANVQDKIVPLYGSGKAEHSMNSAAMTFPDMHIPCRPLPSRTDMAVATDTNAVADHDGEHSHDSEIDTISARHMHAAPSSTVGVFACMLGCCMTAIPSYRGEAHNGAAPRHRFSNKTEFVLHWAFIFVASIAIICFTVC